MHHKRELCTFLMNILPRNVYGSEQLIEMQHNSFGDTWETSCFPRKRCKLRVEVVVYGTIRQTSRSSFLTNINLPTDCRVLWDRSRLPARLSSICWLHPYRTDLFIAFIDKVNSLIYCAGVVLHRGTMDPWNDTCLTDWLAWKSLLHLAAQYLVFSKDLPHIPKQRAVIFSRIEHWRKVMSAKTIIGVSEN